MKHLILINLILIIISVDLVGFVKSVHALELNIEDQHKLMRVMAEVKDPQIIVVKSDVELDSIELENIEGILPNIYPTNMTDKEYIFYDVSPGNWKVLVRPKSAKIMSIKLQKE